VNLSLLINTQFPFTGFSDFPVTFIECAALVFVGAVLLLANTDAEVDAIDELELGLVSNFLTLPDGTFWGR